MIIRQGNIIAPLQYMQTLLQDRGQFHPKSSRRLVSDAPTIQEIIILSFKSTSETFSNDFFCGSEQTYPIIWTWWWYKLEEIRIGCVLHAGGQHLLYLLEIPRIFAGCSDVWSSPAPHMFPETELAREADTSKLVPLMTSYSSYLVGPIIPNPKLMSWTALCS